MLVAHLSDLHYCAKHLDWVDKAVAFSVADAASRNVEAFILSGDSFDSSIATHEPAYHRFIARIAEMLDIAPVFVLAGTQSHDRPGALTSLKYMRGRHTIYVADRIAQVALRMSAHSDSADWVEIASDGTIPDSTRLLVSALPSINRANVQAMAPEASTGDLVSDLCRSWSITCTAARTMGIPTVGVSHGTVNGCVTESKQALVSADHEFGTGSLFSAEASAFMLGHIHLHQAWQQAGRRIAYPGSITKLIYGHAGDNGYLLWDVRLDGADFELVRTPERRLVDIEYKGPPDLADLRTRLRDLAGAWIRLRYTVDEEHRHTVDSKAIKDLMAEAAVAEFKIEARVNPVQRTRAAGIAKAVSTADKLARWAELSGVEVAPLLPRLAQLESGQQPGVQA